MNSRFPTSLWLIPLLLMAAGCFFFPKWIVDDAYISYRYAANWLETGAWSWNLGEKPIEGFTGYLLPLLAALVLWLDFPLEPSVHFLGILTAFGSLVLFTELFKRLGINPWISFMLVCLYTLYPFVYVHTFSGLETNLFTFLLLASLFSLTYLKQGNVWNWRTALLILVLWLLALTRPEGILMVILLAFGLVYRGKSKRIQWLLAATLLLVPVLAFQVWRRMYFGDWLPNSVQAKHYPGFFNPESVKAFIAFGAYYALIPMALGFLFYFVEADREGKAESPRSGLRSAFGLLALVFVGISLAVYAKSHLFMNFSGRFFAPMAPMLLIGAGILADNGWASFYAIRNQRPKRWRIALGVILCSGLVQLAMLGAKWKSELAWVMRYQGIMEEEYKPVAQLLKSRLQPGDRIVCYMDAGAIPYFSSAKVTDFGRLNDAYLPTLPQGSPKAIDYFFDSKPKAAVFTSQSPSRLAYLDEAHLIQSDPRFSAFDLLEVFSARNVDDYFQFVYFRRDSAR